MSGERAPEAAEASNGTRAAGGRTPLWQRLRQRLQGRADSEHEQIVIRVAIAALCLLYLGIVAQGTGDGAALARRCVPLGLLYLSGASLLLVLLLRDPGPRPARRYAGMTLDVLTNSTALTIGEGTAAVFYPFYLWVTLGMGFRYGRSYLLVAAVFSLIAFATVIWATDYWHDQLALSAGLLIALLVLPAYASTLLAKLTDALARAEEANRIKDRFLATMSHELRTPLHAIIGMADLLRASRLRGEQQDMVRTVQSAGRNLLEMIADLLDIAKIESGNMTVQPVPFDLHALLATVRALLNHQAHSKGLQLRLMVDPALPHQLHGADRSLQQILVNLVANAVKFTEHGSVTINALAEAVEPDRIALRIDVQDTGIGIALHAQERIFDRFAQADDSATRSHGGTGLGLTIARQLAGLMGGLLLVRSTPGAGSCFTFRGPFARVPETAPRLAGRVMIVGPAASAPAYVDRIAAWGGEPETVPTLEKVPPRLARAERPPALLLIDPPAGPVDLTSLAGLAAHGAEPLNVVLISARERVESGDCVAVLPPDAADRELFSALHAALALPDTPAPTSSEPGTHPWPSLKVLVAEDNRINRQVIEKMLSSAGHIVSLVGNGEEALDALDRQGFDVVLMDVNMPVLDGLEAVKLHRFATGGRNSPPFVALTADATDETRRRCEEAGIDAFLTKPVEMEHLLRLIDRVARPAAAGAPPATAPPPLASDGGAPPLDRSSLDRLRQLDDQDGFVAAVIGDFIADAEELIAEVEAAAIAGDAATFRDRAHALRSSAAHIGATAVFDLCLAWRAVGSAELAAQGTDYAARLKAEFERLRAALLSELRPDEQPALSRPP